VAEQETALRYGLLAGCVSVMVLLVSGCGSSSAPPPPPKLDAAALATAAMKAFDANKDRSLSAAEVESSPSLKSVFSRWDADHNGKLTEAEIAAQIKSWTVAGAGLMRLNCVVRSGGKGVPGVHVTLKPESFLGNSALASSGVSNQFGEVDLSCGRQSGVMLGLYRIEITSDSEKLPAKFNTATTLGQEVAPTAPNLRDGLNLDISK